MEKNDNSNYFDFLPENSIITYKKMKFNFKGINASEFSLTKKTYFYDIYTEQFIYFIDNSICIFNKKGILVKSAKYKKSEKIRFCTCEKNNNCILIITDKNKIIITDLKKQHTREYNSLDVKTGKALAFTSAGFFIPKIGKNKDDKKKEGEEYNFGLISSNSYRIVNLLQVGTTFQFKNIYISDTIPITEYYFNNIFNVLIVRNEYQGFFLINLKNSTCYNTSIELNINNVYLTSKFYLQNIYNKLYFIHFTEDLIEFYRLNNLKEKKEPEKILFNKSGKSIDYELTQIQFYNNLMILYLGDNIRLYDLKANHKKKFGKIEIPEKKKDGFFDKIKISGKFVVVNNDIYKIKFLPQNYLAINEINAFDTFFNLLRRKNCIPLVNELLIKLLEQNEFSTFYAIIYKIIENYEKSKKETKIKDSKNANEIIDIGHNFFYLSQDDIFSLFSNNFSNIENLKVFQIMITIYNEYSKKKIPIDEDVFLSALFNQLNKIEDFSILDFMIKNNFIPVNKKLGLYLIDRSKTIMDKDKKTLSLNLGVQILLAERENIDDVIYELIEEEKYEESITIITDFYFGFSYKLDKKNKDFKEDINKHLRKFITEKLNNINKLRGQASVIYEENIEF
jgi:hypothetical protein